MTKDNTEIKQQLHSKCLFLVNERFEVIQRQIQQIQESLASETKSTAGDKHETGRAMLQLEREKAGQQLAEINKVKQVLSKIDSHILSSKVSLGSVVYTTQANYFISVSLGELKLEQDSFFAISPGTPIGQLLLGKAVGDKVTFRSQMFTITKIF
ncbi:GreA/GreB family elongation factor [Aestuariibaculum sediminum]|uniref:GreA/GreB family elongation factor n=1 Tax=Aestuariibaculum sediminum TaxID=2770637 RepID=A0A8J6UFD4_9FLAO|nr:GreA/GreB family elongation factor [Aestuariibaculum sediminum]MBD0831331.1 GreA/GreB family elongation factor [Aestuariibaculum sediminum]